MENVIFEISFRCYYADGGKCDKRQPLKLSEIGKWIECYKFTHPNCESVSVKVWFSDLEGGDDK